MRTSTAWWQDIKRDPARLQAWLYDQYRGEVTAADRIERLRDLYCESGDRAHRILTVIAAQERDHARWVGELLEARGLEVVVSAKADRYWTEVLPGISDLETGAAVGAHAERMRLARIEAIATDPATPTDIHLVFTTILPQERFHARAFARLSTPEAMARTAHAHALGRAALGLVA